MGKELIVGGYVPAWGYSQVPAVSWSRVTNVFYFSVKPGESGEVDRGDIREDDLKQLVLQSKSNGFRVSICVGGWERSEHFAKISEDKNLRAKFVSNLVSFIDEFSLSGVDLDWEHPKNEIEVANYGFLIRDLRKALGKNRLLTAAMASWQDIPKDAAKSLDWVNLMSYDHDQQHSSFASAVNDVKVLKEKGIPANQIVLGLPFYGRDITKNSDAKTNRQLEVEFNPPFNSDMVGNYYRNGSSTLAKKVEFVLGRELAGVMIWELSQDTSDGKFLKLIKDCLSGKSANRECPVE